MSTHVCHSGRHGERESTVKRRGKCSLDAGDDGRVVVENSEDYDMAEEEEQERAKQKAALHGVGASMLAISST